MTCSKCKCDLPENAKFCHICGKRLGLAPFTKDSILCGRSQLLTSGAFLLIVASSVTLVSGLFAIDYIFSQDWLYGNAAVSVSIVVSILLVSLFGLLGFGFGIASGVNTLRRKQFVACLMGAVVLVVAGMLNFTTLLLGGSQGIHFVIFFGFPATTLAIIGLAFLIIKRHEFGINE